MSAILMAQRGTKVAAHWGHGSSDRHCHIEHRIELEQTSATYRLYHEGAVLLENARDPEFQACRALLALGLTGQLVTYSVGSSTPRMRIDIRAGAKMSTTAEGRFVRWQPFDRELVGRAANGLA